MRKIPIRSVLADKCCRKNSGEKKDNDPTPLVTRPFSAADFERLSEDEFQRFPLPSKYIGNVFVYKYHNGLEKATQFAVPGSVSDEAPHCVQLSSVRFVKSQFGVRPRAKAPDGTSMIAKRSIDVKAMNGSGLQEGTVYFFSPKVSHRWARTGKTFWGDSDTKEVDPISSKLNEAERRELVAELDEIGVQVKEAVKTVDHAAVAWRDTNRERGKSQNDVMGRSAIDEFKTFADEHEGELSDTHLQVFQKAEKVRAVKFLRDRYKSQDRPEWLHRIANSLHAKSEDPQTEDNLAAAPKYINTKMMLTERAIKDTCLHDQNTTVTEHTRFELLWGSDILLGGFVKADFVHEPTNNAVMIHQHLNPWIKYPRIHRSTDIAQTALVTRSLLADVQGFNTTITRPLSKHYHPSGIVRTPVVGTSSSVSQRFSTPIPAIPAAQLIAKVEQTTHGIVLSLPNGQRLNVQLSPAAPTAVSHSVRTLHASEEDGDSLSDFDDDSDYDSDYEKDDGFIASEDDDDNEIIQAPKNRMRQLKRTDFDEESDDEDSEHESDLRASYSDDDSGSESDEQESDLSSDESEDESEDELSESDLAIKEITFIEAKAKIDQSMKSLKDIVKTPQQQQSFGFYRAEVNSLLRGYNARKGTDDEQTLADLVQRITSIYSNYRAQIKELGRLDRIRPGATSFTRARLENVIDKYEELVSTDNNTVEPRRSKRLQST